MPATDLRSRTDRAILFPLDFYFGGEAATPATITALSDLDGDKMEHLVDCDDNRFGMLSSADMVMCITPSLVSQDDQMN